MTMAIFVMILELLDCPILENYLGKNIILVPTFWSHGQFGPYILVAVNLVSIIFNLHLI